MFILGSHHHNKVNNIEKPISSNPDSGDAALDELFEWDGFGGRHYGNVVYRVALESNQIEIGFIVVTATI